MTDLATADVDTPSTVVDTETKTNPSGAGQPQTLAEPSLRDTIAAAVKESAKEEASPEPDKAADEGKSEKAPAKTPEKPDKAETAEEGKEPTKGPERGADGKFTAKEAAPMAETEAENAPEAKDADTQGKPNGHIEPPRSFLPDAKETWRNTPRAVQRDVENMARQHETEIGRFKEAADRYEPIRAYDEAARQAGRQGVHESLAEVVRLEKLMQQNPLAGLNHILMQAGPRKADGQPMSLFELAHAIVQTGQDGYNRMIAQQPQQQQEDDPRVAQLEQRLAQMQEQTIAATVIEPFRAANPRYDELQDDIALFLKSGRIPASLSPSDRLAAAYDMAVRINPASHANDADTETDLEPARRADNDLSGSKSIKSAPGAVTTDMEPDRGGSIRDLLAQEMKRAKRS